MNSSQLSLFDTKTANGSQYKAGDWVKTKRKAAVAAWVKRGEVFQISQVHPINGSLKFWNPHINQWDFLYPEEVKLTVEPIVGELVAAKPNVESVVGEPILEPIVGELVAAKPNVESVVGELVAAKPNVESVVGEPILEPVVGELVAAKPNVESVVGEGNYYNSDKGYSGNGWLESHYKIRHGGKQHSINCPEIGCSGPYYSYRWMDGKRQRAKYCPASKCTAVRKALRSGKPISKILEIINQ